MNCIPRFCHYFKRIQTVMAALHVCRAEADKNITQPQGNTHDVNPEDL